MFSRKQLCVAVAAIVLPALGWAVYPAVANAVPIPATSYFKICANGTPLLCLRDPSDGGSGTKVLMTAPSTSNSEHWVVFNDTGVCRGVVAYGCGIPNFIVNLYGGQRITFIQQQSSAKCMKFSTDSGWKAIMGTCGTNGSLMIDAFEHNNLVYYFSLAASENDRAIEWLCSAPSGKQPFAGPCTQGWGDFTASTIVVPLTGAGPR